MSIITWVESGKKYHAVFDPKYFSARNANFPLFESHRKSFEEVKALSEDDILLVSGDRKKFRVVEPMMAQAQRSNESLRKKTA